MMICVGRPTEARVQLPAGPKKAGTPMHGATLCRYSPPPPPDNGQICAEKHVFPRYSRILTLFSRSLRVRLPRPTRTGPRERDSGHKRASSAVFELFPAWRVGIHELPHSS